MLSSRRRKTLIPTSAALRHTWIQERLRESTLRKNPELESLRWFVGQLHQHSSNSCDTAGAKLYQPCCSFGSIISVERGDLLHGQQLVLWNWSPGLRSGEDTPAPPSGEENNMASNSSLVISQVLDWRKARCQGLLLMVGEILGPH